MNRMKNHNKLDFLIYYDFRNQVTMLFSSLVFLLIFLPSVLLIYYILGKKLRNLVLLTFSLLFYAYGEPKYLAIMILSIGINYIMGLLVDKYREEEVLIKFLLFFAVAMNLAIIIYYKYSDFIIENTNRVFSTAIPMLNLIMPIGISFFTFQGLSYVIDIYRKNGKVQKNPLNVALYISLFPQLIAGPIVRYETVADQIDNRIETLKGFSYGVERFIFGLGKKILIANSVGLVADQIFNVPIVGMSVVLSWIGIISYTGQIYFDFSGYSDMAIGLGHMFGFEFLENFNYPYISKSITEFWRNWHISLGTWFRDYVYIPLGGNRVNTFKFLRNILIVWFLTGLWHGAAWNFIIWGLYYGVILVLEKAFIGDQIKKMKIPFQHLYTMILVMIGWLIFRSETMEYALSYLKIMFGIGDQPWIDNQAIYYLDKYKHVMILSIILSMPIYPYIKNKIEKTFLGWKKNLILNYIEPFLLMLIFLISIMYLVNSTFNPFIYFRF